MTDVEVDVVFIGSCTNSRIEDLRSAANIASRGKVSSNVQAIVVPGSNAVRKQAEQEGLDSVFKDAGFEWRLPGCSMCLGMNDDGLKPGRCASTSNRNFEGRQGRGSIITLVSPAMAAAAALQGRFVDIWSGRNDSRNDSNGESSMTGISKTIAQCSHFVTTMDTDQIA